MVARTLLALMLGLSLLIPFTAINGAADWSVGDSWAVGTEEDFSELFDTVTEELRKEIETNASGFVDYDYQNEGIIGVYYFTKVVDDTGGLYRVNSELGFYIHTYTENTFVFEELPVEGNHTDVTESEDANGFPEWKGVKTEKKAIIVQAGIDFVISLAFDNLYTQDGLDLESTAINLSAAASYQFKGLNLPEMHNSTPSAETEDSTTYDWMSWEYHTGGWSGEVSASLNVALDFEPALNIFDLPIQEGEIWGGESNVTMSGDIGAVIDLNKPEGVPQEFFDEFYEGVNSGFDEANITKSVAKWADLFPLNIPSNWMPFEDLNEMADDEEDIDLDLRIEGNRFKWGPVSSPEPLPYNFTTGEQRNITLPGGSTVEAFEIVPHEEDKNGSRGAGRGGPQGDDDEEGFNPFSEFDFKPFVGAENGQVVSVDVESDVLDEAGNDLEAPPVEPTVAEDAIDSKANADEPSDGGVNEDRVWTDPVDPYAGSDDDDDDEPLPAPGLLGLMAVMAIVALLPARRRKK